MSDHDLNSVDDAKDCFASTEQTIALLWQEVLDFNDMPLPDDDFFALGGDSVSMVMLEFRIKEELLVDLPAGVTLGAPTLRELSALVDAARGTAGSELT